MELLILGSAAAEGWPALFCVCDACRQARRLGGRDRRRRTSYRLGDAIQIDWGPDTFAAMIAHDQDMTTLRHLVVTHAHEDHFTPLELTYRRPGFSRVPETAPLTVHGSAEVEAALRRVVTDDARYRLAFNRLVPFQSQTLTPEVSVTPILAAHPSGGPGACNFIFACGERQLLIGNDTGWWEPQVWEFLAGVRLSVAVIDATYGAIRERRGHLGVHEVVEVKQELERRGAVASSGCRFIANHFSHNGGWLHAQLVELLAPHGIDVGYDGMTVGV